MARTAESELKFIDVDEEMSVVYIFKRHYLFGKRIYTTRKKIALDELIKNVRSGIWELEFTDEYYALRGLFICSQTLR